MHVTPFLKTALPAPAQRLPSAAKVLSFALPAAKHESSPIHVGHWQAYTRFAGKTPTTQERALRLQVRQEGFPNHLPWALAMDQVVLQVTPRVQAGEFSAVKELIGKVASQYHHYMQTCTEIPETERPDFGILRTDNSWETPVDYVDKHGICRYQNYLAKTHDLLLQEGEVLRGKTLVYKAEQLLPEAFGEGVETYSHQRMVDMFGTPVLLTTSEELFFVDEDPPQLHGTTWHHTADQKNFDLIFRYMDTDFQVLNHLRTQPNTPEKLKGVLACVAQIHWLTVQMMPFERGTAGITDITSKILLESCGVWVDRWKPGILPDCEALTRSLESFKENYGQFFDAAPRFTP